MGRGSSRCARSPAHAGRKGGPRPAASWAGRDTLGLEADLRLLGVVAPGSTPKPRGWGLEQEARC